jgi:hypothetical protein
VGGKLLQNRDGAMPEIADKSAAQRSAVTEIQNRDKVSYSTAWDVARREKPELFS